MASCDPRVEKEGKDIFKRWFKEGGIIGINLGKDSSKFFKQFYESTLGINFDSPHKTPTYAQMKHLHNRVRRLENGFQKKTGKIAEMFYLSDEVVKRNYQSHKTFKYFMQQHDFYQGKRDKYQQTLNTIVHMLGEKARGLGLLKTGSFKDMNHAHKELQKRYNEYQRLVVEEGWGKAESYFNENIGELAKEEQFAVFELADQVLRNPDIVTSKDPAIRKKYGMFNDIATEWKKISPELYKDLKNGLDSYIRALKESNKLTNNKYSGVLKGMERIREKLTKQPNYFPTEALNVIPTMRVIQESIYDRAGWEAGDYDKLTDYVENIADVMGDQLSLSRHTLEKKGGPDMRTSVDVISTMDKYIRNVTMFNFAGRTTESLLKGVRKLSQMEGAEAEEQAKFYSKYLYDTHAALLGLNINSQMGRNLVRGITSFEFMSKLGLNLRGALRNATQSLQNIVYFGVGGTYQAFKYLQGTTGKTADAQAKKYGVYFANARELTNTLGLFPEVATVAHPRFENKQILTYKYDSKVQKFTNGLEEFARKTGAPMRIVENKVNRQLTFKIAFALHHRMLNNNQGIMAKQVEDAIARKDIRLSEKQTVGQIVDEMITERAGQFASNAVKELHYEYSPFAKPKIMRGGVASVLTQFMTYGVNFYNYQHKIAREAKDSIMAGDWKSEESFRLYRLGTLYSFLYGIMAPLTNTDIGNLVQHDTYERFKNFSDMMSSDPKERKRAFYGKGPVIGTIGGPFISDAVSLGNVFGFYDLLSNGEMRDDSVLGYLAGYEDYSSKRKNEKLFDIVRVLNTQVARTSFVTLPRMWNGASIGTLAQIESGLFKDKVQQQKKLDYIYPLVKPFGVKKPKYAVKKGKKKKPQQKSLIMESLESLSKTSGQYA